MQRKDKVSLNALRPTIVIADDHPEILEMVAELLHPSFTILAQSGDGESALNAIKERCPQLAVLDLSMPRMHGMEVAKRLSEAQSLTKVIFLTRHMAEEYLAEARCYGHGYVIKARLHSDLLAALHAALQGKFFASDPAAELRRDRRFLDLDRAEAKKRLEEQCDGE
jgi:DNA-binding NarL/FixJ family response regulator